MLWPLRIFFCLWIVGSAYSFYFDKSSLFHWIGLGRPDVFNTPSLEATNFRIVYLREQKNDLLLLPMMNLQGDNLTWMLNENFWYRTYLYNGFFLTNELNIKEPDLKKIWSRGQKGLSKPALYDFCRNNLDDVNYRIIITHLKKHTSPLSYRLHLSRSEFPNEWLEKCKEVHKRTPPPFFWDKDLISLDKKTSELYFSFSHADVNLNLNYDFSKSQ